MNKLVSICTIALLIGLLGACSKDDVPSSERNISGYFSIDGKSVKLNYGYFYCDEEYTEYAFFDRDMLNYFNILRPDVEYSGFFIICNVEDREVDHLEINYKTNPAKEKGGLYSNEYKPDEANQVNISIEGKKIRASSISVLMDGFDFKGNFLGYDLDVSFSVEGEVIEIAEDGTKKEVATRGIAVKEIKDLKQIAFFKSLKKTD